MFGYHLVNFIIHFTATVFLYLFIKNSLMLPIFDNRYHDRAHLAAFLSAIIWAIHPIHVTAVTYIVQRMASMAGMFTIMSMYGYLKARTAETRPGSDRLFRCLWIVRAVCLRNQREQCHAARLPVFL